MWLSCSSHSALEISDVEALQVRLARCLRQNAALREQLKQRTIAGRLYGMGWSAIARFTARGS